MRPFTGFVISFFIAINAYTLSVSAKTQLSATPSAVQKLQNLLGTSKRTLTYRVDHWFEADEIYQLEYEPTKDGVHLTFIDSFQQNQSYFISADLNQAQHLGSTWLKTGVDTYDWAELYRIEGNLGIIMTQNDDNPSYVGFYIVRGKNGRSLVKLAAGQQTFFDLEKSYDLLRIHEQNLNEKE